MKHDPLPPWYFEARLLYEEKTRSNGTPVSLRDLAKHFEKNVKSVRHAILRAGGTMRTDLANGGRKAPVATKEPIQWTRKEKAKKKEAQRVYAELKATRTREHQLRYEAISKAYLRPGATNESVAKEFGITTTAVIYARRKCGVTAKEHRDRGHRSAEFLAPSRAALLVKALTNGEGPFTQRDLERRFQKCSAFGAALAMSEAEKLGAVVTWEPWPVEGGVRLTLKARTT